MESHFDIVVIGGGPAATAAAIHASQAGLNVCIIERETFPRDRPGESLHPGIEPLLKQLKVMDEVDKAKFLRFPGIDINWKDQKKFQAFNEVDSDPWFGFQAYRKTFDNILLEKARHFGVMIKLNNTAKEIACSPSGRIIGLITNNELLTARYLIDASGSWQWLSRQLNIPFKLYSQQYHVRYGYVTGSCPKYDKNPCIFADKQGWTWIAKVHDNCYQWTRLSFSKELQLSKEIPEDLKMLKVQGSIKGADMTWRIADKLAGPGFFLTGDAGAILDPASSHGVLKAMMSGIYAADLISKIIKGKCEEETAFQTYQNWMQEWFLHDVSKLKAFYQELFH